MASKHHHTKIVGNQNIDQEVGKLLTPFQRKLLQDSLKKNIRSEYRRRIEIMLMADRGHSQTEICAALNCSHETARYWIFIAKNGQAHQWKNISIGRPKTIDRNYLNHLESLVYQNPRDCGYAFTHWTAQWLSKHLEKELGIKVSPRHINRLLKQMGLSTRYKRSRSSASTEQLSDNNSKIKIANLNTNNKPQSLLFSPFG